MKPMTVWCVLLALTLIMPRSGVSALSRMQGAVATQGLLTRHYEEGERLSYRMTATNRDRTRTTSYTATAKGVVKRDSTGRFFEEFQWSELVWNGAPFELPPASQLFRQVLSLSSDRTPSLPDFSQVHPRLVGLVADLLSFYADAWLAMQQPNLRRAGDRVVVNHGEANSWADGARILLGEDAIDFAITLDDINNSRGTATFTVRHVPPEQPKIRIPADWMRTPVADVPNNWVQVARAGDRRYVASIGKETFDVELQLNLMNGRIVSARMTNPVEVFERECTNEALTMCSEGIRYQILRQIGISDTP